MVGFRCALRRCWFGGVVLAIVSLLADGRAATGAPPAAPSERPAVASPSPSTVPVPPGCGIDEALFALKEMDMHLHAGMERQVPLSEWMGMAFADGRKVIVLLDHLELYRKTPEQYAQWAQEEGFEQWYRVGAEGRRAFMNDMASVRERGDVITFRGWEISEGELDTGIEREPMRMAEVIGWHISPNHQGNPPDGQLLIRRIQQLAEVQNEFPVPMILFHPFTMRLEHIQQKAREAGRDVSTLTVEEYRFFQPGEQERVAELLRGKSIYVEVSRSTGGYWKDPICRAALIADIKPLAEMGVQFTVSTDGHGVRGAQMPFEPRVYCDSLAVTPANANTMVRELLALRARKTVNAARGESVR